MSADPNHDPVESLRSFRRIEFGLPAIAKIYAGPALDLQLAVSALGRIYEDQSRGLQVAVSALAEVYEEQSRSLRVAVSGLGRLYEDQLRGVQLAASVLGKMYEDQGRWAEAMHPALVKIYEAHDRIGVVRFVDPSPTEQERPEWWRKSWADMDQVERVVFVLFVGMVGQLLAFGWQVAADPSLPVNPNAALAEAAGDVWKNLISTALVMVIFSQRSS